MSPRGGPARCFALHAHPPLHLQSGNGPLGAKDALLNEDMDLLLKGLRGQEQHGSFVVHQGGAGPLACTGQGPLLVCLVVRSSHGWPGSFGGSALPRRHVAACAIVPTPAAAAGSFVAGAAASGADAAGAAGLLRPGHVSWQLLLLLLGGLLGELWLLLWGRGVGGGGGGRRRQAHGRNTRR